MERKHQDFEEIRRLEDALDLGAQHARTNLMAMGAARSLAGAAEVFALAWAHAKASGMRPTWIDGLGLSSPPVAWLGSRDCEGFARAEVVPSTHAGHQPGSRFIQFQGTCASELAQAGMRRGTAARIVGAFAEMTSNAIEHSESRVVPFSTFQIDDGWWEFSVTDLGVGVPESLRTNPDHSLLDDKDAVKAALQDGVSRMQDARRGTGFGVMLRALAEHECIVRLRTGSVVVLWTGRGIGLTDLTFELVSPRPGVHLRVAGRLEA